MTKAHLEWLYRPDTVEALRRNYDYYPDKGIVVMKNWHTYTYKSGVNGVRNRDSGSPTGITVVIDGMPWCAIPIKHFVWAIHYGPRDTVPRLTRTNNGNDIKITSYREVGVSTGEAYATGAARLDAQKKGT